jgi:hypothetical protein
MAEKLKKLRIGKKKIPLSSTNQKTAFSLETKFRLETGIFRKYPSQTSYISSKFYIFDNVCILSIYFLPRFTPQNFFLLTKVM